LYSIVGVGKGVESLIESFNQYKEYKTYFLDEEILGDFSSMEEYENNFPVTAVKRKLKGITKKSEVLYVIEGGENISGVSLRMLEILKKASVKILYVIPDRAVLNEEKKQNESLTFKAFQDIVRSGDLDQIILVDLERVEMFLGDIPLENYDKALAYNIVNTFAMLNYFDHIEPVKSTKKQLPVAVRISTFGFIDPNGEEHLFYDLQKIKDKEYCYGVTQEDMKKSSLLREIKDRIKTTEKNMRCHYSIHLIDSDQTQKYIRVYTDICQIINEKIDPVTT
tara:strand:- start:546 stop:1385 length:840 start_codon:yes stop_codon:yes gene_type:complete